jgi:hypothetical protein
MPLLGSRASFVSEISKRKRKCSECGERIMLGQPFLISRRNGVVKKVLCSEKCRQDFDARYWDARATMKGK